MRPEVGGKRVRLSPARGDQLEADEKHVERWPSGRRRLLGKQVCGNPAPRVRIPPSPPVMPATAKARLTRVIRPCSDSAHERCEVNETIRVQPVVRAKSILQSIGYLVTLPEVSTRHRRRKTDRADRPTLAGTRYWLRPRKALRRAQLLIPNRVHRGRSTSRLSRRGERAVRRARQLSQPLCIGCRSGHL